MATIGVTGHRFLAEPDLLDPTLARARELGRPQVWAHAGNRRPSTHELTSLGPDQGGVTWEGFSS